MSTPHANANVYVGDGESDNYWAEGVDAQVEIERTDTNEIRVGFSLNGHSDDCTIFLTDYEATRLAQLVDEAVDPNSAQNRMPIKASSLASLVWNRIAALAEDADPSELLTLTAVANEIRSYLPTEVTEA